MRRFSAGALTLLSLLGLLGCKSVKGSCLSWCASLQYLLVVHTEHLVSPQTRTGSDFISGKADGRVFVFELPSGKAIGGYAFKVENSQKVMSNALESDLRVNFGKALSAGLTKADPGATLVLEVNPSRS